MCVCVLVACSGRRETASPVDSTLKHICNPRRTGWWVGNPVLHPLSAISLIASRSQMLCVTENYANRLMKVEVQFNPLCQLLYLADGSTVLLRSIQRCRSFTQCRLIDNQRIHGSRNFHVKHRFFSGQMAMSETC